MIYTESLEAMKRLAERANISFIVRDRSGNPVIDMMKEGEDELNSQLNGYLLDKQDGKILEQTSYYEIRKAKDIRSRTEYIEMWGSFDSGYHFLIRTPLDSIREGAKLSTRFLAYVGCIMIGVSCILVWYFSRKITDPIMELAMLSQKMANLDFNAKYTSGGDNEIGVLGDSFNRMSEKLEQTISQLKTANFELQKDIEQKEKQEERRKEFIGNVSHELKTPLTSMKVLADSLLMQPDAPTELYREFMGDLSEEIERENKIINDLLDLVKLDKKGANLNIKSQDVNELVERILKRLQPLAAKSNIELVFESFRPVTAEIDEVKIALVITNLVENAIKYNKENGWVHVSLNADHKYFYLKVADSGIGIPKEDTDHIFERFFRVDKSHSREIGGTGLGLSIARNAVVMHRGAIKVYSEP